MISTAVLALSLLTVLLRLAAGRARPAASHRLADAALAVAAVGLVLAVADPAAWAPSLLFAPARHSGSQPVDPRLPSHLAFLVAVLASLPAAFQGLRSTRPVPALMPGVLGLVLVAAAAVFLGLSDALALLAVGLAGLAGGIAAGALVRGFGAPGAARGRALLVCAAAVVAGAATLTLYGHRSDPEALRQDGSATLAGLGVAYRGLADTSSNPRHLMVEVQQGLSLREYRPSLGRDDAGVVTGTPAGARFSGPVVAALAWQQENADAHPYAWLGKGETLTVRDAVISFKGFRSEKGPPVRFYADLAVERNGATTTVSPGLAADSTGSTPFAAEIPGLGPVAVARMDADGGRVAIMMAGLQPAGATSTATLRLQLRPGLEVAWGALGVAILAALLALFSAAPPATPPVAANPD